jgi:protein disulfide-isomerase A6
MLCTRLLQVRELVDEQTWEDQCVGHAADADLDLSEVKPKQLCLIAFLPHILDSKAEGREAYLQVHGFVDPLQKGLGGSLCVVQRSRMLQTEASCISRLQPPLLPCCAAACLQILRGLTAKYKDRPFSYLWAEGGAQPGLEANFGVGGYGYPALIAFNPGKAKYANLKSAFEDKPVKAFIESVRLGFERVATVSGPLATVEARAPWDGSDGEEVAADEFDLADLMGDDEEEGREEL